MQSFADVPLPAATSLYSLLFERFELPTIRPIYDAIPDRRLIYDILHKHLGEYYPSSEQLYRALGVATLSQTASSSNLGGPLLTHDEPSSTRSSEAHDLPPGLPPSLEHWWLVLSAISIINILIASWDFSKFVGRSSEIVAVPPATQVVQDQATGKFVLVQTKMNAALIEISQRTMSGRTGSKLFSSGPPGARTRQRSAGQTVHPPAKPRGDESNGHKEENEDQPQQRLESKSHSPKVVSYYRYFQSLYTLVYAVVCGFRSFFPRQDVEKYCLFDYPILSSVVLGRGLSTVAEICLAYQVHLFVVEVYRLYYPLIVLQDERETHKLKRRAMQQCLSKERRRRSDSDVAAKNASIITKAGGLRGNGVVTEENSSTSSSPDAAVLPRPPSEENLLLKIHQKMGRSIKRKAQQLTGYPTRFMGMHPRYWLTRICEKVIKYMIPAIYTAECCSWIGVCTRIEIWNGVEETIWGLWGVGCLLCSLDLMILRDEALDLTFRSMGYNENRRLKNNRTTASSSIQHNDGALGDTSSASSSDPDTPQSNALLIKLGRWIARDMIPARTGKLAGLSGLSPLSGLWVARPSTESDPRTLETDEPTKLPGHLNKLQTVLLVNAVFLTIFVYFMFTVDVPM